MLFNDREAARIAVEIEKNGVFFYRTAMKLTPSLEKMLSALAGEEEEHVRVFSQIAQNLTQGEDYSKEDSLYLSALASSIVLPGGVMAQAMKGHMGSLKDILRSAISSEKDSIAFYSQILQSCKNPAYLTTFRRILHEEKRHLQELMEQLEKQGNNASCICTE